MNKILSGFRSSAATERLIDTWLSLPREAGALCPKKSAFSPTSLGKHLNQVVLFEHLGPREIMIRVIGTGIQGYLHEKMTGKNLFDLLPPEHVMAYSHYYKNLRELPCAGSTERPLRGKNGTVFLACTVHLPLTDEEGNVRYYLGMTQASPIPKHFTDYRSVGITAANNLSISYSDIGAGIPEEETYYITRAAI
ncbi:PAS domain-containing protein [Kordiimonas sp. SCSIO 12603]|uniref:PAS domain-containing protein n=1 Tax=Kordiimonas sp. SCSIO 12603 TaxID=2829596 RepID=UPI002107EC32|nr:PAS domain-containing protein [Kordiimonas sp. SCSIO 12603]UTW60092.1 PAS domain-containing protein [Kordiimonas sp. SCSIO 12603]